MITFIFIAVSLSIFWCDYKAYCRIITDKSQRKIWHLISIAILDSLHFVVGGITFLFVKDNSQIMMGITSWILTIYTATTIARLAFYAGWFTIKNRVVATIVGSILCAIILYIFGNGIINTRTDLTVKRVEIKSENIPDSFCGFRILFFSDLHIGAMVNPQKEIPRLIDKIAEQRADMVIFGGDLVHIRHDELKPEIIASLSKIKAPYGVYTVLGNHDTGTYVKDSISLPRHENIAHFNTKIGQAGWRLLRDSTIYAVKGADSIAVTGIDFTDALLEYKHSFSSPETFEAAEIFAHIPDSLFNIAISHLPQLWHNIKDNNLAELTLSGHVHATQIAIECFGVRLSPAMLMYKEWSGLYQDSGSSLYITDGIGCVGFNMRIGAKPEITVIELSR